MKSLSHASIAEPSLEQLPPRRQNPEEHLAAAIATVPTPLASGVLIPIASIVVIDTAHRSVDEKAVADIAKKNATIGLQTPITVRAGKRRLIVSTLGGPPPLEGR